MIGSLRSAHIDVPDLSTNQTGEAKDPVRYGHLLMRAVNCVRREGDWIVVLVLFLTSLTLNAPSLVATYSSVNPHDEAKYVSSGADLLSGELRDFAWGPVVAFIYAPVFLLTRGLPFSFFYAATVGRFAMYLLVWISTLWIDKELRPEEGRSAVAGVLFVCSPFAHLLANSSDALFTCLSAMALACVLRSVRMRSSSPLGVASLLLGVSVLTRPGGTVQCVLLVAIAVLIGWRMKAVMGAALWAVLPSIAVVSAFLMLRADTLSEVSIALRNRTYATFEQGQWIITGGDWGEAPGATRELFGTPAENGYSVFRAAARNPGAYAARLERIVTALPGMALDAYGKRLGPAIFCLALLGAVDLVRRGLGVPAVIMGLWSLSLLLPPFVTAFLREGLLMHAAPIVYAGAAMGLAWITRDGLAGWERLAVVGGLVVFVALAFTTGKPAIGYGLLAVVLASAFGWLGRWVNPLRWTAGHALFVLLCAGMLLRPAFTFPDFPKLGAAPQEQAIMYLRAHVPEHSNVVTALPLPALAAMANPVGPISIQNVDDLRRWLRDDDIRAIYSDSALRQTAPDAWAVIESAPTGLLTHAFLADPGSIEVLMVGENP